MNKKILLIDVDSKIPNLVLMKLSTYYKSKGYKIDLIRLRYVSQPHTRSRAVVNAEGYEKVFASIIFTMNKDVLQVIGCEDKTG